MHKHSSYPLHSIVDMVDVALPTASTTSFVAGRNKGNSKHFQGKLFANEIQPA